MKEDNKKFNEILEIVKFIKNSSATKDDLSELQEMFEQNMSGVKTQLFSVENELDDIKEILKKLEVRVEEDTDSVTRNVCVLEKKFKKLHQKVSRLQTA
ncbi:MAG: hypothetical protein A2469_01135 [Candidatus Magasanikbacteria bacterium RIFOXYC2_FULL_40_16]|uniref:Uncharacterized protein n=1 Tax=Candidatus Magasanikbacteria bacterium RIFOXYC2_FULL_40_16 TaxID=1798703 RepID=A0A1F6P0V6_9BACT|nr:MAG: hypothetical protein A2224_02210 [Candidatus Magasanikbacteria bacterium RIFOXYA2_FULL_40_20]OGH89802.1 MAG: hypothetical protein A2469_01135 [Candidatus Magasanikbacteria bacterium RIFOXYC2_FULL_40_16]